MARCRNESSRGANPAVSQRKKIDDTEIRDTSTTDAGIQTLAEVELLGPSRVSVCAKATNSEPMYKVLAVSSRGQSRRDKTLPETLLLNNDSSRPALERATTTDTENSAE